MADFFQKFNGTINRRDPRNEGPLEEPWLRENWLCRDGVLKDVGGTEKAITTTLTGIPRWAGRYYTIETGIATPKTFIYTDDGKLWVTDDLAQTASVIKELLKLKGYPKHQLFKTAAQTKLFLVDGDGFYRYDGNNDNLFEKLTSTDTNGASIAPIDVIEHKDRLWLMSRTNIYVSKNLDPETFNDANDSIVIIVGSGRGKNLAWGKLEDRLYILNTEGIFVVEGDVISALASTFEVRLVDERKIIASRSATNVERAIVFLGDDYELWSWDGSEAKMLSYKLKLRDFVSTNRELLDKCVSTYFNNYYMLSFVEKGEIESKVEVWWDAFEDKMEIIRGRNVSCYLDIDPSEEEDFLQTGRSDIGSFMHTDRGYNFDGAAIVTKLRTRDIVVKKGHNVRFLAFYPEIQPTGNRDIAIKYLLDGRLSNPTGADAYFDQNLQGEVKVLGFISIGNQSQGISRVRPKINYARGESITFEIEDSTLNARKYLQGIGIDFVVKFKKKSIKVGA